MDDLFRLMEEEWGSKTLADLRAEALATADGFKYRAFGFAGRRVALVVCVTGAGWIAALERVLNFEPDTLPEDLTLFSALARCEEKSFLAARNAAGDISFITLLSAVPDSTYHLARLLGLG